MIGDLDGVACILGVIIFAVLRQPDCFAFDLCTFVISCEDIRYLMLRLGNFINLRTSPSIAEVRCTRRVIEVLDR